jgi:hypothetical protein
MTKLTIKPQGSKGNTFEAESLTVLRTLNYYAANKRAFCFYKNERGWQKLSVSVAKRYAHVIAGCERVVVAIIPRRFKFKALKGFPKHRGFLSLQAKSKLSEKCLPYRKTLAIRFYRGLVAEGKVQPLIFNGEKLPEVKQISAQQFKANCYLAEIRERANRLGQWEVDMMADRILNPQKNFYSFKDRQISHLAFTRNWSLTLSNMTDKQLASTESAEEWQKLWAKERQAFLEDLEALRLKLNPPTPPVEDTQFIGRYDVSSLLAALKPAKKHAALLPKGFVKGFDNKQVHLIHIRPIGTEIEILAADSIGNLVEESFIVYGSNRGNLPPFQISLALEQLHNTAQYPGILDLDKDGRVYLEINFTRKLLTVVGIETRYRVNLKLITAERREDNENVETRA